jgi:hypothetical protein
MTAVPSLSGPQPCSEASKYARFHSTMTSELHAWAMKKRSAAGMGRRPAYYTRGLPTQPIRQLLARQVGLFPKPPDRGRECDDPNLPIGLRFDPIKSRYITSDNPMPFNSPPSHRPLPTHTGRWL